MSKLWTFISENADALGVIIASATLIGGVIGFFIDKICKHFSKSSKQKKEKITDYENTIADLENKVRLLQSEAEQYHDVIKGTDGDYLLQTKTLTKICPICWNKDNKTIPVFDNDDSGQYECSVCHHKGVYNYNKYREEQALQVKFFSEINQ